mmetsp:Transcript_32496/g.75788  ORF Transcript_32496/g.75788 Transcript_32496/m.75788 type:complete len:342 (+) Transcript_32496:929-1954(+)
MGAAHSPQPAYLHFGLSMIGASHSPSSSSSQSSGVVAFASGTLSGSSSYHSSGFVAAASTIFFGASSSQSSGFDAAGSSILGRSTHPDGFLSVGSSMYLRGLTAGLNESSSSSDLLSTSSPSTRILTRLSAVTMAVYRCVPVSDFGTGGETRCFSSKVHSSQLGRLCCRMKCTLFVFPHLSGPNITVYGVEALNPVRDRSSDALSNLMYAPPHVSPSLSCSSYWTTSPTPAGEKGLSKTVAIACRFACDETTRPVSPSRPSGSAKVSIFHSPVNSSSSDTVHCDSSATDGAVNGSKKTAPSRGDEGGAYADALTASASSSAHAAPSSASTLTARRTIPVTR